MTLGHVRHTGESPMHLTCGTYNTQIPPTLDNTPLNFTTIFYCLVRAGMKDSFDEHVAIFWDYENCTPPCNIPGYDVVNNIRRVAHEYGSVKLFKAYLELSEQASSKSLGLRSELQSCGVSLTDCPHNGRKDVADKMMIVDMLTYAIDNPAPATIVLISGDRDFVYAVSVLCLRRYRVVVVAPYTAHNSLQSQASVVLDWEVDIMGRTPPRPPAPGMYYNPPPTDDALHRSPRRPPVTFGGTLPSVTQKSNVRPSLRPAVTAPVAGAAGQDVGVGGLGGASQVQGRHFRSTSAATVDGTLPNDPPSLADRSAYRGFARPSAVWPYIGDEAEEDETIVHRRPIPDIVQMMGLLREDTNTGRPAPAQFEMPTAAVQVPPPSFGGPVMSTFTGSRHSTISSPPPDPSYMGGNIVEPPHEPEQPHGVLTPPTNSPRPKACQPTTPPWLVHGPAIGRPATLVPLSRLPSHSTPEIEPRDSIESPLESLRLPSAGAAAVQGEAANHSGREDTTLAHVMAEVHRALTTVATSSADTSTKSAQKAVVAPPLVPSPPAPVPGPTAYSQQLNPPSIPHKYATLVSAIRLLKARGEAMPLRRSVVGEQIRQLDPNTYSKAGVKSFKQYTSEAESLGIIVLGGLDAYAWIMLSPPYE
ncbi:NYN domain-containing protein [Lenzites betulinus]|nr:NYN domain-containing protein [Lenzites betulinus]